MTLQHSLTVGGFLACKWLLSFVFSLYPLDQLISNPQFRLESAVSVQLVPDLSDPRLFFVGKYLQGLSPLKSKGNDDVQFRPLTHQIERNLIETKAISH